DVGIRGAHGVRQQPAELRHALGVRIDGVLVHVRAAVPARGVDDVAAGDDGARLGEDLGRARRGGHAGAGAPAASCARSQASMKASRSPSSTASAFPTSVLVRRSFTIRYGCSTYERIWWPKPMSVLPLVIAAIFSSCLRCSSS